MNEHEKNRLAFWQNHAWRYFEFHANQRIILFRFYIAIFIFFISAMGFLFIRFYQPGILDEVAAFATSIVFIILTIIFQLLDYRNRQLIHYSEDALVNIEGYHNSPEINKIFTREKINITCVRHTVCFMAIYIIAYIIAIAAMIASVLSFLNQSSKLLVT